MANKSQLRLLKKGANAWNYWRRRASGVPIDLTDLVEPDLRAANLTGVDLSKANLSGAKLFGTNLTEADLTGADLTGAHLFETNLTRTNLTGTTLACTNIYWAVCTGTDFRKATLRETILANLDLSSCKGLETCIHRNRSVIDIQTLERSGGQLPLVFLRGVGMPEKMN